MRILFVFLFFINALFASSLKIAVAANVRFAFDEIAQSYEKTEGIKIIPIVSSSGKLTAQIQYGAPFDLFLSANMKYPKYLYEKKLAITKPKVYAKGSLVLWSLKDNITLDLKALEDKNIKKIAIPNPKSAPYGIEGMRVLNKYNLAKKLLPKIVFGESVSQTNQYIYTKSAEIGLTAKSVVLSPKMRGVGKWKDIDKNDYFPIKQGIVILKYGEKKHLKESLKFYNFMFGKEVKNILKRYGYSVDE